jgi:phosphate/sulfate permease
VATANYTHSLEPVPAVVLSGVLNFLGVVLGGVAIAFTLVELVPADVVGASGAALFAADAVRAGGQLVSHPPGDHPRRHAVQADRGSPPPWWVRGLLILDRCFVSFAHGSNDGQKSIGLIMPTIIGIMPAAFSFSPEAAAASPPACQQLFRPPIGPCRGSGNTAMTNKRWP